MNISSASGVCHTGQKVMHRAILYGEEMYVELVQNLSSFQIIFLTICIRIISLSLSCTLKIFILYDLNDNCPMWTELNLHLTIFHILDTMEVPPIILRKKVSRSTNFWFLWSSAWVPLELWLYMYHRTIRLLL